MKAVLMLIGFCFALPVMGQTMYKCPNVAGTVNYQQMPCSPTGGGETLDVKTIRHGAGSGISDAAKKYLSERDAHRAHNANRESTTDSLDDHIQKIKKEELAKDCYALEKRIHWIKRLEADGIHLKQDSMGNDDSKEAIEEYKKKCGHWG